MFGFLRCIPGSMKNIDSIRTAFADTVLPIKHENQSIEHCVIIYAMMKDSDKGDEK
jgi:hypothetical protein